MARFTASTAFDINNFDLSTLYAGATNSYDPTNVNVGLKPYDGRLVSTDSVAPRQQMLAFLEDDVREIVEGVPVFTGGTVGLLQFNVGFGTTGWQPAFRLSSFDYGIQDFVDMLETADVADDRAFLSAMLAGDDQITLSVFRDNMSGGAGNDLMNANGGHDTVSGGEGNDTVDGALGNDIIFGNQDNDSLIGGRGFDTMFGGIGDDVLRGGVGKDNLTGGDGSDLFDFKRIDGNDTVTDYDDTQDFFRVDVLNTAAPGMIKTQDESNVVVTFAGVDNFSITILNETASNITLGDFIFV
jgi:Ca2+-binding RTX toxin-like protein